MTGALDQQARANNGNPFAQSPQLLKSFLSGVVDAVTDSPSRGWPAGGVMSEKLFQDQHLQADMIELVSELCMRLNETERQPR